MIYKYKTIENLTKKEIVEKKSRFIASILPVENEDEAQAFLLQMKKQYYNATHNCYAFVAGIEKEIQRAGDDGEPSGTAGIPMLEVLRGEEIKNVVVNVTRYFGGTLLGTGGLARAYSRAVREVLLDCVIIEKILYTSIYITVSYHLSGKISHETLQYGGIIKDTIYSESVAFEILILYNETEKYLKIITEISSGTALVKIGKSDYITFNTIYNAKNI